MAISGYYLTFVSSNQGLRFFKQMFSVVVFTFLALTSQESNRICLYFRKTWRHYANHNFSYLGQETYSFCLVHQSKRIWLKF